MVRRLIALCFATLLLLGACGDDSGSGGGGRSEGEPAPEGIEGVQAFDIDDAGHVEGSVDYPSSPPVAGDHNPI